MTKTGIAVGPNRFEKLAFPSILPFCTNVDWSFVWNFEFVSRAAQALAPRVGICLKFGFWCLEFYDFNHAIRFY